MSTRDAAERTIDSQAVDASICESGLRIGQIRGVIPEHLMRPSEARSWFGLARVVASAAACLAVLSLFDGAPAELSALGWLGLTCVWLVYGFVLVGLFVIGHDCGHQSFSRHRLVNRVVGYLTMSPLGNGYHTWKLTHDHHHAYTQLKGQEVDWGAKLVTEDQLAHMTWRRNFLTRLGYAVPFGVFLWIGWNTIRRGLSVRSVIGAEKYARERRQLLLSNLVMLTCGGAIAGTLLYTVGIWGYVKFHGVPALIAAAIGAFIVAVGHANEQSLVFEDGDWTPTRGQMASTYDIRFSRVVEYLICDINIHIPHHVSTRVPWYHLREASDAIRGAFPELYQEHRFRARDLAWCVRTPVLEKDRARGFYRLVPRSKVAVPSTASS